MATAYVSLGLFLFLSIVLIALLLSALVIIPGEEYRTNEVFVAHLAGLLLLAPAIAAVLAAHHFIRGRA